MLGWSQVARINVHVKNNLTTKLLYSVYFEVKNTSLFGKAEPTEIIGLKMFFLRIPDAIMLHKSDQLERSARSIQTL